jgi:hypothetical protein
MPNRAVVSRQLTSAPPGKASTSRSAPTFQVIRIELERGEKSQAVALDGRSTHCEIRCALAR